MNTSFDFSRPVVIGSDHAGYEYKTVIADLLHHKGLQVKDFGTLAMLLLTIPTLPTL